MVTTSAPLFVSSGDLIADRRYKWAIDHARRGDLVGAAEILVQTVELAPEFATAWFALGAIRDSLGDRAGAVAAFAAAHEADPDDYHGARLHLARLGASPATPEMTAVYVRRLFDQHAPDFDTAMREHLAYRGPELLLDAVRRVAAAPMRFVSMLDLGCGSGLAGAAFRPHVDWLVGIDLSPAMIAVARSKGLYDRLIVGEVGAFLREEGASPATHHLVVAADVFVYCSDLAPIVVGTAQVLAPDGLFAFTVETHDGAGVRLAETLRYAHSAEHVRTALEQAGLTVLTLEPAATRMEKGVPVAGLLTVARRRAAWAPAG
jgi:predicted TPR repeat methyltransferase